MADMFDGIVMAEQRFHGEGYQEGYAEGSHIGIAEGRRYGSLHGAKIGSEVSGSRLPAEETAAMALIHFVMKKVNSSQKEWPSQNFGLRLGVIQGGAAVGCYLGFALTWRCLLQRCTDEKSSKKIKALESLIGMIQKFPYEDPTYDKLQEDLEKIRGKFKQVCSMLNIQSDFRNGTERSSLTF